MDNILIMTKALFTAAGAVVGIMLGEVKGLIIALVLIMIADWITGIASGWHNGEIDSKRGFKGIAKKGVMLLIVLMCAVLDRYVLAGVHITCPAVTTFYVANEAISMLENAGRMGIEWPAWIQDRLEQLGNRKEDEDGGSF